jgi:hypothetical protein
MQTKGGLRCTVGALVARRWRKPQFFDITNARRKAASGVGKATKVSSRLLGCGGYRIGQCTYAVGGREASGGQVCSTADLRLSCRRPHSLSPQQLYLVA